MENKMNLNDNKSFPRIPQQMEHASRMDELFARMPGEEDIAMRQEFIKHYTVGLNRHQVIVFAEPVHFRDTEDGAWQDIDNTLEEAVNEHGRAVLRNHANRMRVEFPQQPDGNNLASIADGGKTFAWGFEEECTPTRAKPRTGAAMKQERLVKMAQRMPKFVGRTLESLRNSDLSAEIETEQERRGDIAQLKAENTYENILPGISVRYTLGSNTVKEDIILAEPSALQHVKLRLPKSFDYEVTAEKQLLIKDKETGNLAFAMDTPYVYDAAGKETIADICLTDCGEYIRMEYILDTAFVADATFPVTIDPVVISSNATLNIEDTTLCQDTSTNPYSVSYIKVGTGSTGQRFVGLMRFKQLAQLKTSDTVISAQLRLRVQSSASTNYISAHEVLAPWNVSSVNWLNFNPDLAANVETAAQECIPAASSGYLYFDLTNMYKHWCMTDDSGISRNNGVAFRKPDNVSGNHYSELYSADASSTSYKPTMYVNYVSHAGLESWWQYESMSAGRAGTVYTDIFNGNMVLEHTDTVMTGNRMPVSVSHYYNSCLTATNPYYCGYGWKTSAHQYIYSKTISGTDYYIWVDGDGTEHYFPKVGSAPYEDAEGMSLKLQPYSTYYVITDKGNNQMRFNITSGWTNAWLAAVRDSMENTVLYNYNSYEGQIASIVDPAGRTTNFYYTNNLLSSITTPAAESGTVRTVYFTYTYDCLTGVRYSELGGTASHSTYTYAFPSLQMTRACNYDGVRVDIEYEPISRYDSSVIAGGATEQMRRVISLEQLHASGSSYTATVTQRGAKMLFNYLHMCTEVTAVANTTSNAGKKLTYQFNDSGNVVCVRDELGFASFTKYESAIENNPSDASRMRKTVMNLLSAPMQYSSWVRVTGSFSDVHGSSASNTCLNLPSMYITKGAAGGESIFRQTISLECGKTYSLSAYTKSSAITGTGAFLRIRPVSITADTLTTDAIIGTIGTSTGNGLPTDGWERQHLVYTTPDGSGSASYYIELVHAGSGGTVWFGAPQLEEGAAANSVNLIANGDFRYTYASGTQTLATGWTMGANTAANMMNGVFTPSASNGFPAALSGKYLQVQGIPDKNQVGMTQQIAVSGKAGDVYILGGWANAKSVPNATTTDRGFGFAVRYMNTSGTWSDYLMLPMNEEWVGWQHACFPLRVPGDYQRIEVLCVYTKNANTAQFANIFLHREEFGQSFAYDDGKNLIATGNLASQKSGMEYDSYDNLISYRQPGRDEGIEYTMTYGSTTAEKQQHLLKTSTTPMGVKEWFEHDEYGNVIAQKVQADSSTLKMQTGVTYNADGNYVTQQTDARGNAVTIVPNDNVGIVHSVTDAKGQSVNYVYDAANRVTATLASANGGTYRNDYTYENDRIKTVAHNTTSTASDVTYTFNYDDMGRKTSVLVGTQPLSTNVYRDDRSNLVSEVQYGNGGKVKYAYDEFDRVTAMAIDTADVAAAPNYTYAYGANGQIAQVEDNILKRTEQVEYDMANRPCRRTLRDSEGALLYRTDLNFDKFSNLSTLRERVGTADYATNYTYDNDNRLTNVQYG
ncbi:MAG: RHS repeat protein, partial [Clostridiales bacterium]|nr:RHS repeat protein [Clostridiales bacterium]